LRKQFGISNQSQASGGLAERICESNPAGSHS